MKIKLDENIPADLVEPLGRMGHDVHTVHDERLTGVADTVVWREAQKEGRFVITQDRYFADIRNHPPGEHAGVLLLRLAQEGRATLIQRVTEIFQTQDVSAWSGCNVVANEKHVRVRRPQS